MSAVIPAVALPTHIPAVATPTQVAPPTQGLHLFSMLSAQKGAGLLLHTWEGWDTRQGIILLYSVMLVSFLCSLPFLFDAVAPACKHASTVLTTKYAALAGLSLSSPSSGTLLLPQVLASAIDNMPSPPLPPVMDSDDVLFSISRVLYNLLTCCRTTLLSPGMGGGGGRGQDHPPLTRYGGGGGGGAGPPSSHQVWGGGGQDHPPLTQVWGGGGGGGGAGPPSSHQVLGVPCYAL